VEDVFRALADPKRRLLLDKLFERDGQTLVELEAHAPEITRFGVMKHLRVLEDAGLVVTKKVGREKFHYLNPVPLRRIHDRWLDKFTSARARALLDLQHALERRENSLTTDTRVRTTKVLQIVIKTTPERLWAALTLPEYTQQYFFGSVWDSTFEPGSHYSMKAGDFPMIEGTIESVDAPRKLVTTFHPLWSEAARNEGTSRVTYEIEPRGEVCKLTVTHDDLIVGSRETEAMIDGWTTIVSGLKTLLETGAPLPQSQAG
jgi:uncharacterized protein YndB with AHSA1/START domain/DNA-binding transcriptional ArsR family regulator